MNTTDDHSGLRQQLRAGMVGVGMIFDETYRPFFETVDASDIYDRRFGVVDVSLAAVASRTGKRAAAYRARAPQSLRQFQSFSEPGAIEQLLGADIDFVCVATPDTRHFEVARRAIESGRHVLIEKPSVVSLQELDTLCELANRHGVLAKVVYHKLFDPDHKRLRTLVLNEQLQHVNNGYCSLLEPKQISGQQFAEWITGRNPGTYVAVHYLKLIDFTFGGSLQSITATGQRGLIDDAAGSTWDSVQMRVVYRYEDHREAAFDIHTSWVTPDNFPGYVEQEVQFRFDNGVWNGHSRKRGVECTVEGQTPLSLKTTLNNHYSASFVEPDGRHTHRGYGLEVLEQFVREVAYVEFGGDKSQRVNRIDEMRQLDYNDIVADRQVVAAVEALEAILQEHVRGVPDCVVRVNDARGGLVLYRPGDGNGQVLYQPPV